VLQSVAVFFPGVCIVSDAVHDVRPEQYPTVIREMIRHEDDVTNHRVMWLLVGEGFVANAYVSVKSGNLAQFSLISLLGIVISLSAFRMLYQSYQAKGYLEFLGQKAEQGALQEKDLPLMGWPRSRIKGWWRTVWSHRWIRRTRDLLEPWILLPYLFANMWVLVLLHAWSRRNEAVVLILSVILSAAIFVISCIALLWSQSKDDDSTES